MISRWLKYLLMSYLLYYSTYTITAEPITQVVEDNAPIIFTDQKQEKRYLELAEELRCLVCQNQNLIDSNSGLAHDLRQEVARLVKQGQDKKAVKDFMVARYGDFILYQPPLKPVTYLLWVGPFVLMIIALLLLVWNIKKRSKENNRDTTAILSEADKQHLNILLKAKNK